METNPIFVFFSRGFQPLQLLRIRTPAPTINSSKMPLNLKSAGVGNTSILSLVFLGCLNEGFVVSAYMGGCAQRKLGFLFLFFCYFVLIIK